MQRSCFGATVAGNMHGKSMQRTAGWLAVALTLPVLDFQGTPAGIDVRKCVDTGIAPIINTGIAHREAGVGQIGAGVTRAPMECLEKAVVALADQLNRNGP